MGLLSDEFITGFWLQNTTVRIEEIPRQIRALFLQAFLLPDQIRYAAMAAQ